MPTWPSRPSSPVRSSADAHLIHFEEPVGPHGQPALRRRTRTPPPPDAILDEFAARRWKSGRRRRRCSRAGLQRPGAAFAGVKNGRRRRRCSRAGLRRSGAAIAGVEERPATRGWRLAGRPVWCGSALSPPGVARVGWTLRGLQLSQGTANSREAQPRSPASDTSVPAVTIAARVTPPRRLASRQVDRVSTCGHPTWLYAHSAPQANDRDDYGVLWVLKRYVLGLVVAAALATVARVSYDVLGRPTTSTIRASSSFDRSRQRTRSVRLVARRRASERNGRERRRAARNCARGLAARRPAQEHPFGSVS